MRQGGMAGGASHLYSAFCSTFPMLPYTWQLSRKQHACCLAHAKAPLLLVSLAKTSFSLSHSSPPEEKAKKGMRQTAESSEEKRQGKATGKAGGRRKGKAGWEVFPTPPSHFSGPSSHLHSHPVLGQRVVTLHLFSPALTEPLIPTNGLTPDSH